MSTKISWTDESWNPVTGCAKIAPGCLNCYAHRIHQQRHKAYHEGKKLPEQYKWNFTQIRLHKDRLEDPLHWKKPRKIFVCSMGDLFHKNVPFEFISKVLTTIAKSQQHIYQILTKRPKRMAEYFEEYEGVYVGKPKAEPVYFPLPNLWLGTSISTQADADKNIPILLQIPAAVRFLSVEPMLPGKIDLWHGTPGWEQCRCGKILKMPKVGHARCDCINYDGNMGGVFPLINNIDWVIIGCESGPNARLCSLDDIRHIRDQCKAANVPVFIKQVPINSKCNNKPVEWPKDLRIQEYPISRQGDCG